MALGTNFDHYAYVPLALPAYPNLSMATHKLLSEADRALGRLDAKVQLLPNPSLLVRPSLTKEAVATTALEGTYAPLADALEAEFVDEGHRTAEVREVMNYVRAAQQALDLTKELPICLRLVAQLQKTLVKGTRGDSYDAGELRRRQVCIGEQGRGVEASRFVPPPPGEILELGVSQWEKWINADSDVPVLVKAALSHYQFETLHPFSDGNGRLGRLLITLQLIDADVIKYPILNLSPWLEPRRDLYIDHLLNVSATGNFDPWVAFFAQAVKARADAASRSIEELLAARDEFVTQLKADGARGMVLDLAGDLIGYPVLDVSSVVGLYDVAYPTANTAVARLEKLGILTEITGRTYGRAFRCRRVFDIVTRA